MDLDDSLSLTLSELEQGERKVCWGKPCKIEILGIPRITGTMEMFDSYAAVNMAYNLG